MLSSLIRTRKRGRPDIFQYCLINCKAFCKTHVNTTALQESAGTLAITLQHKHTSTAQTAGEPHCNSEGGHWWFIGDVSVHCPFSAINLILSLYRKIDKIWNTKWTLFLHRLRNQWGVISHLNIIYQKHDILGQVEVTEIEDNWIADHSLSKYSINLRGREITHCVTCNYMDDC